MMNISKQLIEDRKLSESSVNAYLKTLFMLNNKKPFKSLTFLKKTDEIQKKMEPYAQSTQKSILGAIASVLSLFKDKAGYKKTYEKYSELLKERKTSPDIEAAGEKTDKEKAAWLNWEDVQKRRNELYDEIKSVKKTTPEQYATLLNYVVLSLYTLLPPRRNQDYLNMKVVSKWNEEMSADCNYLDLNGSGLPTKFIFNKYKTAKKHGQQQVEIPKDLASAISLYLKHHPLRPVGRKKTYEYPFLVTANAEPLTAVNAITRILNKIFGKKIGSSMLRHIFLSNKYDISEMQKDADLMGHTVSEQRNYLRAEDGPRLVIGEDKD